MAVIITVDLDFGLDNEEYRSFARLVQLDVNSLPSPSDFGKDGQWGEEQRKQGRIYCLRPPDARSLPLCIFHDVFREYLLDIEQPLPLASDTATSAQKIAAKLRAKMGMYVSNERTKEFDACISDFLGKVEPMYILSPANNAHSGIADGVLLTGGILITLREIKAEPGASGDVYMQVARCYDLAVKALLEFVPITL